MHLDKNKLFCKASIALFLFACLSLTYPAMGRVGGGGGHSSGGHSSGGSHSSGGGHSYSGGNYSSGDYGGGGAGISGGGLLFVIFVVGIAMVIAGIVQAASKKQGASDGYDPQDSYVPPAPGPGYIYPDGLDETKIKNAFYAIQDAWQLKYLSHVRKWLSDGMYQKLTTQFKMMSLLDQRNEMSNISVHRVWVAGVRTSGPYQVADVGITFSLDDSFISDKYPQFNESYRGDSDTEYWTFIKRTDSKAGYSLYDSNSCPNCGAPLEVQMGEISRCSSCNTLTNNAAYDWVLSEITQDESYTSGPGLSNDYGLKDIMKNDPLFAVQRMEDIASNVFMQVMEVLSFSDARKLGRFSDERTIGVITSLKQSLPGFVFDRLYLDSVTMSRYSIDNGVIRLLFSIRANYRRVAVNKGYLEVVDVDFVTRPFSLELSRNIETLSKPVETVYSYECSSCGAPYNDTTEDKCNYCDAPVVDKQRDWVLTGFVWG